MDTQTREVVAQGGNRINSEDLPCPASEGVGLEAVARRCDEAMERIARRACAEISGSYYSCELHDAARKRFSARAAQGY